MYKQTNCTIHFIKLCVLLLFKHKSNALISSKSHRTVFYNGWAVNIWHYGLKIKGHSLNMPDLFTQFFFTFKNVQNTFYGQILVL